MSRGKKATLVAGIIVGALLVISLLLPVILDLDKYRKYAADLVGEKINRKVSMEHLKLSIWGGLGVELQNLTVSNNKESGKEPFISVDRVKVEMKALPLLKRKIEIKQVLLERPQIRLELYQRGRYNFSDILETQAKTRLKGREGAAPGAAAGDKQIPAPAQLAGAVIISKLSMRDGEVTFIDRHTRPGVELVNRFSDIDLRVDNLSPDAPFELVLKARVGKSDKQNLMVTGMVKPDLKQGTSADFNFRIKLEDIDLSFINPYLESSLPMKLNGSRLTADFHISGNTSEEVIAKGELSLNGFGEKEGKEGPHRLSFKIRQGVKYDVKNASVTLGPAQIVLGKTELEIQGTIKGFTTEPVMDLTITSTDFDLDTLSHLYPPLKDKIPEKLKLAGKGEFVITLKGTPKKLKIRGEMDMSRMEIGYGIYFQKTREQPMKVDFQAIVSEGSIQIETFNSDLGDLWFDLSGLVKTGPDPELDLKFLTSPVTMETLKKFVPGMRDRPYRGKLRMDGWLKGPVNRPEELQFEIKSLLIEIGQVEDFIEGFPTIKQKMPEKLKLEGEVSAEVTLSGSRSDLQAVGKATLNTLRIKYGDGFDKPPGFPMEAVFDIEYRGEELIINKFNLSMGKIETAISGNIKNLTKPRINLNIASNSFSLQDLATTLPPLEKYDPGGHIVLNLRIAGEAFKPSELAADGEILLKGLTMKAPGAKTMLKDLTGKVILSGRSVEIPSMTISYGRTVMRLGAEVKDFSAPKIKFAVDSSQFFIEDFIPPKVSGKEGIKTPESIGGKQKIKEPSPALKVLVGLESEGLVRIRRLVHEKFEATNLEAEIKISKGTLEVDPLSFDIFGGSARGYAMVDFSGPEPRFRIVADLKGVEIKEALQGKSKIGKALRGKLYTTLDIRGTGDKYETLSKTLNGKGRIEIENGSFTGFSLLRSLSALTGIQGLPGANQNETPFDSLKTEFELSEGRVHTDAVSLTFKDYDFLASGYIGLDKSLSYDVEVTLGESLSNRLGSNLLGGFFTNSQNRMVIPLKLSGLITKPKVSLDAKLVEQKLLEFTGRRLQKSLLKGSGGGAMDILRGILGGGAGEQTSEPQTTPRQREKDGGDAKPFFDPGKLFQDLLKGR